MKHVIAYKQIGLQCIICGYNVLLFLNYHADYTLRTPIQRMSAFVWVPPMKNISLSFASMTQSHHCALPTSLPKGCRRKVGERNVCISLKRASHLWEEAYCHPRTMMYVAHVEKKPSIRAQGRCETIMCASKVLYQHFFLLVGSSNKSSQQYKSRFLELTNSWLTLHRKDKHCYYTGTHPLSNCTWHAAQL